MNYSDKQTRNAQRHDDWDEVHQQMIEVQEMKRVQKKSLAVSDPGDADEKEADEVARKVSSGESAEIHGTGGSINRKGEGSAETTPEFQSKLESSKGGGQSLDDSTRSEMESKMGADFGGVKIHTGGEASAMSESINAKAFTHGQDVYFNNGYSPQNTDLLAHELVHTVQQKGSVQRKIQRAVKFEIQTGNYIWLKQGSGFSHVGRKFGEFGATERGELPAYITTGKHGSPAKKQGTESYEEVKGPLLMKKAKPNYNIMVDATADVPPGKTAQYTRIVLVNNLDVLTSGDKPKTGDLTILPDLDRASEPGIYPADSFIPGVYEIIYYDATNYHPTPRIGPPALPPDPLPYHQSNLDDKFSTGAIQYMKETTVVEDSINVLLPAQYVKEFRFTEAVTEAGIKNKPVGPTNAAGAGQIELVRQIDNADVLGDPALYNPGTYEYIYYNSDGSTRLDVHLNEEGVFKEKHWPHMKIGRQKMPGLVSPNRAQYVTTWRVLEDPTGTVSYYDPARAVEVMVRLEQVQQINNGDDTQNPGMATPFVADTYENFYYWSNDFSGSVPDPTKELNVHLDDSRLKPQHISFMEKVTSPGRFVNVGGRQEDVGEEQTAMELQAESHGYVEFETPKWFSNWEDLRLRVQDAVDMTQLLNSGVVYVPTTTEATTMQAIKNADPRIGGEALGTLREWPTSMVAPGVSTRLGSGKLYVEIVNTNWPAFFQTSESATLANVGGMLQQPTVDLHSTATEIITIADQIFDNVKSVSTLSSKDDSVFENLRGFLELVLSYIMWAQLRQFRGHKDTFPMMARTDFASMYSSILSADEQQLFREMLGNPSVATDNPIFTSAFQTSINTHRAGLGVPLPPITLNRTLRFYSGGHSGGNSLNPYIYNWLTAIPGGTDLLAGSQANVADAIGGRTVDTAPGSKTYRQAQFELRAAPLINADGWVDYAKLRFDQALTRSEDLPDDPTTPGINETSRTSIKLN